MIRQRRPATLALDLGAEETEVDRVSQEFGKAGPEQSSFAVTSLAQGELL